VNKYLLILLKNQKQKTRKLRIAHITPLCAMHCLPPQPNSIVYMARLTAEGSQSVGSNADGQNGSAEAPPISALPPTD